MMSEPEHLSPIGLKPTNETNHALEPRSAAAEDLEVLERAKSEPVKFSGIDVFKLGEVLAKSGFFTDTQDAAQAIVKILAGQELGVGPIASMSGIDIVLGRPRLSANLLASLIKGSRRYSYRMVRLDDDGCLLEFWERLAGGWTKLGDSLFTRRDAIAAGLASKDTYKKFPRNMFFTKALYNGARWYCPDVFVGDVDVIESLDLPASDNKPVNSPEASRQENGHPPDEEPWAVLPQVKMNIIRLWERAINLGITEAELRNFLGSYGCVTRKEISPEQSADFVSELSKMVNDRLKSLKG